MYMTKILKVEKRTNELNQAVSNLKRTNKLMTGIEELKKNL